MSDRNAVKPIKPRPDAPSASVAPAEARKIMFEPFDANFALGDDFLVYDLLPRVGLAAIYGKPGGFKSFLALDLSVAVASGSDWAGRETIAGEVVYLAGEGASGLRKRRRAYRVARRDLPTDLPIHFVPLRLDLGRDPGDARKLGDAIEEAGLKPKLVVIDTLSASLGTADENGAGMLAFVSNADALAKRFSACVLTVHHTGHADEGRSRMRGHSSFGGAVDVQIVVEKVQGELAATLTLQKAKEAEADQKFKARLAPIVVGRDRKGRDVTTLIVDSVAPFEGERQAKSKAKSEGKATPARVGRRERLLTETIRESLIADGALFSPSEESGEVRAVNAEIVRERYYAKLAEDMPSEADEAKAFAERRRKAFNRAIGALIEAKELLAGLSEGRRLLWFPA